MSDIIWKTQEDVEKDIWLYSEISNQDTDREETTPAVILQYNARMGANRNTSIFDSEYHNEDVTYVSSGRGRGGISNIYRPGVPAHYCQDEEDKIKLKLREVSGLGYSNEIIEKKYRSVIPKPRVSSDEEFCDIKEDTNLNSFAEKYVSPISHTSLKSDISRGSTPLVSPIPTLEKKPTEEKCPPPPLSEILRNAKKKSNKENDIVHSELNPEAAVFEVPSSKLASNICDPFVVPSVLNFNDQDNENMGNSKDLSWRKSNEFCWRKNREYNNSRNSPSNSFAKYSRSKNGYSDSEYSSGGRSDEEFSFKMVVKNGKQSFNSSSSSSSNFDIKSNKDFPVLGS